MFQSFMNLWQYLIVMGSLERRGFGALHPQFWRARPATGHNLIVASRPALA